MNIFILLLILSCKIKSVIAGDTTYRADRSSPVNYIPRKKLEKKLKPRIIILESVYVSCYNPR